MNLESDDTDNDDNLLFGKDTSTDDSEHGKKAPNILHEHPKKSSNTRKNISEKNLSSTKYIFLYLFRIRFSLQVRSAYLLQIKKHSFVLI
jgi:hypothetical protein